MDLGGRRSPAIIVLAYYDPAQRRICITDCLSFALKDNRYIGQGQCQTIGTHAELVDVCVGLRETYGPPTILYADPNVECTVLEMLESLGFGVERIAIRSYNAKLEMLRSLERCMSEGRICWRDSGISDELRAFAPQIDQTTGRYDFPDKLYDKICCLGFLQSYFGERRSLPFIVRRVDLSHL
jgi:hypothetical protein